jgi:hypothetical protein
MFIKFLINSTSIVFQKIQKYMLKTTLGIAQLFRSQLSPFSVSQVVVTPPHPTPT